MSGAAAKQGQGRGSEEQDIGTGTQGCPRVRSHVQVAPNRGRTGVPKHPSLPCLAQPETIRLPSQAASPWACRASLTAAAAFLPTPLGSGHPKESPAAGRTHSRASPCPGQSHASLLHINQRLPAERCARDRSPLCHHLQGILGGSAEGSLAPVSPKKDAQPGQTESDQVGWEMTEQGPGIGGRPEHTVSLLVPLSPVHYPT